MIRAQRVRHRWTMTLLAVLLPAFYLAALGARGERPPRVELPAALRASAPALGPDAAPLAGLESIGARARLDADAGAGGLLEIAAPRPLAFPDLLVYATPPGIGSGTESGIGADARLLGSFPGRGVRTYALRPGDGAVVLYSLAHGSVVGRVALAPEAGE